MIEIRLAEAQGVHDRGQLAADIFAERFLIRRPLLEALEPHAEGAPVLLIDELDRTDEPFEAYLLEVLSDFQVTIPELGTVKAAQTPIVVITSNRTREIHDALKRRCFYHWVDYPDLERELEILQGQGAGRRERLSRQVVGFVQELRKLDLFKLPGVAETIDWATALTELNALDLDPKTINDTLGVLLKYQDDIQRLQGTEAAEILRKVKSDIAAAAAGLRRSRRWTARARRSAAAPEPARRQARQQHRAFRPHPARGRAARSGRARCCARSRRSRRRACRARRLLLDAACGVREPPRPARDLRPGVPRLSGAIRGSSRR